MTSEPITQALRWIEQEAGGTVQSVSPLVGAISSAVYAVDVEGRAGIVPLVLRLFTNRDWLALEPDLARHEAWGLGKAGKATTPTPELIAFDETGERAGLPAVLMTRLPGNVVLEPERRDRWLAGMAEGVAAVHTIEAGDAPWSYAPYVDPESLVPPGWSSAPENWARAIEIVLGPPPPVRKHFIHRDYHPNNVLWQDGRVSGIVDWPNSCVGAAGIDVAWCRQNLASLHGVPAADAFLIAYEASAGAAFTYHPYWDLIAVVECLPGPPGVYDGWTALGVRHLTGALVRERLDDYLAGILVRT